MLPDDYHLHDLPVVLFCRCVRPRSAILAPKEANAAADERERSIFDRAGHYSSYFMGAGVVMSLGAYMFVRSGDLLFYTVFASLMVGQIMEYVFQIVFYRTTF